MLKIADAGGNMVWISALAILTVRTELHGRSTILLQNNASVVVRGEAEAIAGQVYGILKEISQK